MSYPEEISHNKEKKDENTSSLRLKSKKKSSKFDKNFDDFQPVRRYLDNNVKFQKYEQRKKEFQVLKNEIFKKKLEKNNSIRLNAEKKK